MSVPTELSWLGSKIGEFIIENDFVHRNDLFAWR
jgi:hypothetical protein